MQLSRTEDDILERLRTLPFPVFDSEVPDGDSVPKDMNGNVKPHIVIFFGTPSTATGGRGIENVKNDSKRSFCTVQIAALRSGDSRKLRDIVNDLIEGFRPFDSGMMTLMGGAQYRTAATDVLPTLYLNELAYDYITNNTWTP